MDERRARIQEDLRGLVEGDVRCDDLYLQLYASDASIYQIRPLGIVRPRSVDDVVACVQYAAENSIPIHARGAGTGLAGESLGPGLVIDFSKYLRRIVATDDETVRVQPGVVLERLNAHLLPYGRAFGPDPATSQVTTMGSVVAIDGAGSRWLKYGSARQHVRHLQVVLADGEVVELHREPVRTSQTDVENQFHSRIVGPLADLLTQHAELIEQFRPQSRVNRSGYAVWDLLDDGTLDLPKLIAGSEGTLALVTEATLSTVPAPKHRALAMLFFDRLESAARAVLELLPFEPSACDLMDRRHLSLARDTEPRYDVLIPQEAEALLLVEQEGDERTEVRERLRQMIDRVVRQKRLAFDARQAFDAEEIELFWQLARRVVPTLYRMKGSTRPVPFIEDVAVPPEALPGFLVQLQNILKRHQVIASLFAHAGHGQLHVRPFLDLAAEDDVRTMRQLAIDVYREVFDVGGTISGEHGDGLSRTPFLREQYGPLYDVFREVKAIFDPHNIFNPGKIISDDPDALTRNLRPVQVQVAAAPLEDEAPAPEPSPNGPVVELQLNWNLDEVAYTARNCNGCGACRDQSPGMRMCPIFRIAPSEEASPRAKANLMRNILTGQLDPATLEKDDFKEVADLCVNCKMCRLECPAGVDIPRLMIEGKAAYVTVNGFTFRDWVLSRGDLISAFASPMAPLVNWAFSNRQARWLMEKVCGIAQGRKLPRLTSQSFVRRARRRRLTRPTRRTGPKVLYFVDTYANYYDPQLAEALVAVLEHNAVAVYVHPRQKASGMTMISMGALDAARKLARHNVTLLAEAVRQGYHIVASEPAAALCLREEYPALLDDDDARLVAENSSEACTFLWRLHRNGKLQLDLKPINSVLAYHTPCHLRALQVGTPGENLLRLIPGLRVRKTEAGCSGMAGTYGLTRDNFRNSLRAGWGLISSLRETRLQAGTTECSACKMQMEQGTNKPTVHPLKLLAHAYGLMPEVPALLSAQPQELVVS